MLLFSERNYSEPKALRKENEEISLQLWKGLFIPSSARQLLAPLFKEDLRVGYSNFLLPGISDNDNNDNKKV